MGGRAGGREGRRCEDAACAGDEAERGQLSCVGNGATLHAHAQVIQRCCMRGLGTGVTGRTCEASLLMVPLLKPDEWSI